MAYAIKNALLDYPGCWSVHVDQDLIGGWWLVTLTADGFERSVLVPPREQSPDVIGALVEQALGCRTHPLRFVRHALETSRPARPRRARRARH